jgi:hypothetical protein
VNESNEAWEIIEKARAYLARVENMDPWREPLLNYFSSLETDLRLQFLLLATVRWSCFLVVPNVRSDLIQAAERLDIVQIKMILNDKKPRTHFMRVNSQSLADLLETYVTRSSEDVFTRVLTIIGRISAGLNGVRHPVTRNWSFFTTEVFEIWASVHHVKSDHSDRSKFALEMGNFYLDNYSRESYPPKIGSSVLLKETIKK